MAGSKKEKKLNKKKMMIMATTILVCADLISNTHKSIKNVPSHE